MRTAEMTTFLVLHGELERQVAELATAHAAFDPSRRRVLIDDGAYRSRVGVDIVAVILRPDGSISDLFDRFHALSEAWIENGFVRAARFGTRRLFTFHSASFQTSRIVGAA